MGVLPTEARFKRSTYETPKEIVSQLVQFQETLCEEKSWLFGEIFLACIRRFDKDYFKILPGQEIPRVDQMLLLRRNYLVVHLLHKASKCNKSTLSRDVCRAIVMQNCKPSSASPQLRVSSEDTDTVGDALFDLVKKLDDLGLDDEEYALLQALVLLTAHPGLERPEVVQETRCYVLHALCAHTYQKGHWDRPEHIICAKGILRTLSLEMMKRTDILKSFFEGRLFSQAPPPPPQKVMNKNQEELCSWLVKFQELFVSQFEDDLKKIPAFPLGDSEEDSLKRFQHFAVITDFTLFDIVEFCKWMPDFDKFSREDMIVLIKNCSGEMLVLQASQRYDSDTDSIKFANDRPYTRLDFHSACMGAFVDHLFYFCSKAPKMDKVEYALLVALLLFADHPELQERQKVKKTRRFYRKTLHAYISDTHHHPQYRLGWLLATLKMLRILSTMHRELCNSLKAQNIKLPDFIDQMFTD